MANILFTWEIGGNIGHMARLRPFMQLAAGQAHRLSAALQNLRFVDHVLGDLKFRCFQAPFRLPHNPRPTPQCLSFAHTLEDYCFSTSGELAWRIAAWREIFEATRPDVVVYDFSPGALIASHGQPFGKIVVGSGFFNPPTAAVDGVFAPFITTQRKPATMAVLQRNDRRMLDVLNEGCTRAGVPDFKSLAGIYTQADHTFFTTLPELDHFGTRENARYLGAQPSFASAQPRWSEAPGDKVFCYLQNFPGVGTLLDELRARGLNLLIYGRDLPASLRERADTDHGLRFSDEALDLEAVSQQARLAVHHAGQATAIQFLLHGIPQLCVPTQQDQLLSSLQLDRAGVAVTTPYNQKSFADDIRLLLEQERFQKPASHFQQKYANFQWSDSEQVIETALKDLVSKRTS